MFQLIYKMSKSVQYYEVMPADINFDEVFSYERKSVMMCGLTIFEMCVLKADFYVLDQDQKIVKLKKGSYFTQTHYEPENNELVFDNSVDDEGAELYDYAIYTYRPSVTVSYERKEHEKPLTKASTKETLEIHDLITYEKRVDEDGIVVYKNCMLKRELSVLDKDRKNIVKLEKGAHFIQAFFEKDKPEILTFDNTVDNEGYELVKDAIYYYKNCVITTFEKN